MGEVKAMTTNRKGRAGWHQATPTISESICNSTSPGTRTKVPILAFAACVLPLLVVANWLLYWGGAHYV